MYLLAFHGSPRINGNSEILLDHFLEGIKALNIIFEKIRLYELSFKPCIECEGCETKKDCIIEDDLTPIYPKILEADFLVVAAPIFFYDLPSYVKAFFERFQLFWILKNRFKTFVGRKKTKGILLCVGATQGKKLFECAVRSFKCVLDTINGVYIGGLFVRNVDKKGEILKYPEVLELAKNIGQHLSLFSEVEEEKEILKLSKKIGLELSFTP